MEKVHLIFDADKCVGCFNCLLACRDEFIDNDWMPYSHPQELHGAKWITTTRHERGKAPITEGAFLTQTCRHCENAPCIKAMPDCFTRRDDGIVLLTPSKAEGNRDLLKACPYGQIKWNEELQCAQKCTMCAHLLDQGWKEPRCVQACPLRALSIVRCSDQEFAKMCEEQNLQPIEPGTNQPRLMIRNYYKIRDVYVYGAVVTHRDGVEDAYEGADVVLTMNGLEITRAKTDLFGEFKLDRLPKNSGSFEVKILVDDKLIANIPVEIGDECPNIGVISVD